MFYCLFAFELKIIKQKKVQLLWKKLKLGNGLYKVCKFIFYFFFPNQHLNFQLSHYYRVSFFTNNVI
jgi:hypothetical protein